MFPEQFGVMAVIEEVQYIVLLGAEHTGVRGSYSDGSEIFAARQRSMKRLKMEGLEPCFPCRLK